MGISIGVLLRQVRSLFDLEVLMMKYKLFNCICRNGYDWWSALSWIHKVEWLYGLDDFVCCSYALFYFGDDVLLVLGLVSMNMNLKINRAVLFYNVGLNLTAIMLVVFRLKYSICFDFWYCRYWSCSIKCFISYDFIGNKKSV